MKRIIAEKIRAALRSLQEEGALPDFALPEIQAEYPRQETFGEYSSNAALALSKEAKMSPLEIAELLRPKLEDELFESVEVAPPGYLNFTLSASLLRENLRRILEEGSQFGKSDAGAGRAVNNEFISANPTGPLHLGNGRGGFYGDAISRVLRHAGFAVTSEYYINDAGEQIGKLGHSVLQDEEAVYGGEYIEALHEEFGASGSAEEVGQLAAVAILDRSIKRSVTEGMGISFDEWTSERALVEGGYVERALAALEAAGHTYREDEALWFRATAFGDEKDRVLVKRDGSRTYFASECGYIFSKMERGYTDLIEIWGADHHGYVRRFEAAARALGFEGSLRFILLQLVRLMKDGKEVRMSKRAGNVVTIDELLEAVGPDVARFFFLMYAPGTHMNFDLGLAEERSEKNPVFYVQYAHARLGSVLRKAEAEGFAPDAGMIGRLEHPKERELLRELFFFPELVSEIADSLEVHRLPQYAIRLADKLHSFYAACRVIDPADGESTAARLALVSGTKEVLALSLSLMGVSAPEQM